MDAYERRRKVLRSDRDTVLSLWDVDLCDAPTKGMDCFMYAYIHLYISWARQGHAGLPDVFKCCGMENNAAKGAADLRVLLMARVKCMLSTAVREGGTVDERNMYVPLDDVPYCCCRSMVV